MQNLGGFLRSPSSSVCPHLVAISSRFFFPAHQDSGSLLGLSFPVLWFRKFIWEEAEGTVGAPEGFSAVRAWSLAVGVLCLPALLYTLCLGLWLRREGESSGSLSGLWLLDSDEDLPCEVVSTCPHWRRAAAESAVVTTCLLLAGRFMSTVLWRLVTFSLIQLPVAALILLHFFPQPRQLSDTLWVTCSVDSVLSLCPWRRHRISQMKGSAPTTVSPTSTPPLTGCKSQLSPVLTVGLLVGSSHYSLVGFDNLLEWLTELRNIVFTRLLVCCKRLRNNQMEEMPRAGLRERAWGFRGFYWKPHCIVTVDSFTGHWWLIDLPSWELPHGI